MLDGQEIITTEPRSFRDVGIKFVSSLIDVERAERLQLTGDTATVNTDGVAVTPSDRSARVGAAIDTVKSLTAVQLGGLALAGVGIWALVTGKFS